MTVTHWVRFLLIKIGLIIVIPCESIVDVTLTPAVGLAQLVFGVELFCLPKGLYMSCSLRDACHIMFVQQINPEGKVDSRV